MKNILKNNFNWKLKMAATSCLDCDIYPFSNI